MKTNTVQATATLALTLFGIFACGEPVHVANDAGSVAVTDAQSLDTQRVDGQLLDAQQADSLGTDTKQEDDAAFLDATAVSDRSTSADSATIDGSIADSQAVDADGLDLGTETDGSTQDGSSFDGGEHEAGFVDAGLDDSSNTEAGLGDAEATEAGLSDAKADASSEDAHTLADLWEVCIDDDNCASGLCTPFNDDLLCTQACDGLCSNGDFDCYLGQCTDPSFCDQLTGLGPGCESLCGTCDNLARCLPQSSGDWQCTCLAGYEGDGFYCVDSDECETDNGGCGDSQFTLCINNVAAPPDCQDINECLVDNGGCGDALYATCVNNIAAAPDCQDINACLIDNGGCGDSQFTLCINNVAAAPDCQDINECLVDNGGCGSLICVNFDEGFRCELPPGSLDPDFGDSGITTTTDFVIIDSAEGRDLALYGDGTIVITGKTGLADGQSFFAASLTDGGQFNTGFGNAGLALPGLLSSPAQANAVVVDETLGRIYLAGYAKGLSGQCSSSLALDFAGEPVATYGNEGALVNCDAPVSAFTDVVIDDQGQLTATASRFDIKRSGFAMRFDSSGTPDGSFGSSGVVDLENLANCGGHQYINGLGILPDGKTWLLGSCEKIYDDDLSLIQLNSAGAMSATQVLDLSAGTSSSSQANNLLDSDESYVSLSLDNQGRIIAVGNVLAQNPDLSNWTGRDILVSRFLASGEVDSSFGDMGHKRFDLDGADDRARDVKVSTDGLILLVGSGTFAGEVMTIVMRLDEAGSLDSSFGDAGVVQLKIPTALRSEGYALQIDQKDRILITGRVNTGLRTDAFVARLK